MVVKIAIKKNTVEETTTVATTTVLANTGTAVNATAIIGDVSPTTNITKNIIQFSRPEPTRIRMKISNPDSDFVGRSAELDQLDSITTNSTAVQKPRITIVCGLGGIGKTQLARQFIQNKQSNFEHIIWIESEKRTSMEDSLKQVAKELFLPTEVDDVNFLIEKVFNKLSTCSSLIVFDNVDNKDNLKFVLNVATIGQQLHIVITSRLQDWGKSVYTIKLDVFTIDDAKMFISKTLGYEDESTETLISTLENFPLALRQATAYIYYERKEVNSNFVIADYINIYTIQKKMLLNSDVFRRDLAITYEQTTFTTWAITMQAIKRLGQNGKLALRILRIIAFFNPDRIRRDVFFKRICRRDIFYKLMKVNRCLPVPNGRTETDADVISAVQLLVDYSMVNRVDGEEYTIQIHRLVQTVLKLNLNNAKTKRTLCEGLGLISEMLARDDFFECQEHEISVFLSALDFERLLKDFKSIPNEILSKLNDLERTSAALEFGRKVLKPLTDAVGAEDPATLATKSNVAYSYNNRGRHPDALQMYQEVYAIEVRIFGETDLRTLRTRRFIAFALQDIGKHTDALQIFQDIYVKRAAILGKDHDETLKIKHSIAFAYRILGKYTDALQMFEELCETKQKHVGKKHSSTLLIKQNIASIHRDMGNYARALEIYLDVYDDTKHLSENDDGYSESLRTTFYVALTHFKLGKYLQGLQMFEDVLVKQRNYYCNDHPEVFITEANIATALYKLGRQSEALQMFADISEKHKRTFGEAHQEYLVHKCNTAVIYLELGQYSQAHEMCREVLVVQMKLFDEPHPQILKTKFCIAFSGAMLDKSTEALGALQDVFDKMESVLGQKYPFSLEANFFMAFAYRNLGKYSEALEMFENILEKQKNIFGEDHSETQKTKGIITDLTALQEVTNGHQLMDGHTE